MARNEQQSRAAAIQLARENGCEAEMIKLFNRYDDLLKGAKTPEEKEAIGIIACIEFHNIISPKSGFLTCNGKTILNYEKPVENPFAKEDAIKAEKKRNQ